MLGLSPFLKCAKVTSSLGALHLLSSLCKAECDQSSALKCHLLRVSLWTTLSNPFPHVSIYRTFIQWHVSFCPFLTRLRAPWEPEPCCLAHCLSPKPATALAHTRFKYVWMNEEDISVSRSSTQKITEASGSLLVYLSKTGNLVICWDGNCTVFHAKEKRRTIFFSIKVKHRFILLWTFFILNIVSYGKKYLPAEKHNKEDL